MEQPQNEYHETVTFTMGGMLFEYDKVKNDINIKKHGISFMTAARVFFDYDRIEMYDPKHSDDEPRYDTIGDTSVGNITHGYEVRPKCGKHQMIGIFDDVMFVVYTERL